MIVAFTEPLPADLTARRFGCRIPGCTGVHYGRGWCRTHWYRWRHNGNPLVRRPRNHRLGKGRQGCTVDGCDGKHYARGWCQMHWSRWQAHGDPLTKLIPTQPDEFPPDYVYPGSKFTAAQVKTIRRRRAGGETLQAIATDFGTGRQQISRIVNGKGYGRVA